MCVCVRKRASVYVCMYTCVCVCVCVNAQMFRLTRFIKVKQLFRAIKVQRVKRIRKFFRVFDQVSTLCNQRRYRICSLCRHLA